MQTVAVSIAHCEVKSNTLYLRASINQDRHCEFVERQEIEKNACDDHIRDKLASVKTKKGQLQISLVP